MRSFPISPLFLLHLTSPTLSLVRPGLDLTLDCAEARHITQLQPPSLKQFRSIMVENCVNLTLDIFHSTQIHISSLLLVNMTNLQLVLGPQSLSNIRNLVIVQSSLLGDVSFMSRTGAGLTVENCTFHNNLHIYSLHKQGRKVSEYPEMFHVTDNLFNGAVEIFVKVINEDNIFVSLSENHFKTPPTIFVENTHLILHRNIFNMREVATIGTILSPAAVNITNNIFEEEIDVNFASGAYLTAEKEMVSVEDVFDIEDITHEEDTIINGNKFVMKYGKKSIP